MPSGFGFVNFMVPGGAAQAKLYLQGGLVQNRPMHLSFSKKLRPKKNHQGTSKPMPYISDPQEFFAYVETTGAMEYFYPPPEQLPPDPHQVVDDLLPPPSIEYSQQLPMPIVQPYGQGGGWYGLPHTLHYDGPYPQPPQQPPVMVPAGDGRRFYY